MSLYFIYYCMVKPHCLNFRKMTAIFFEGQIFLVFMVMYKPFVTTTPVFIGNSWDSGIFIHPNSARVVLKTLLLVSFSDTASIGVNFDQQLQCFPSTSRLPDLKNTVLKSAHYYCYPWTCAASRQVVSSL